MVKIKPENIQVGLAKVRFLKNPIEWIKIQKYKHDHKVLHNNNSLFYTTSPMALEAIMLAIDIQKQKGMFGDKYAYWEFGVFKGYSLWFADLYAKHKEVDFNFYAFDSFEGLPESKVDCDKPSFNKGHYKSSFDFVFDKLTELDANLDKISFFKGFYSKKFFDNVTDFNHLQPISICAIDVDLYESAVPVLEFIKDYLVPGSIILFDDWNVFWGSDDHSERKALREFRDKYSNIKFQHLYNYGWHGTAWEVTEI